MHSFKVKEGQQALNAHLSSEPTTEGNEQSDSIEICDPIFITSVPLEKWNSTLGKFSEKLSAEALEVLRSFGKSTTTRTSALSSTAAPTITTKNSSSISSTTKSATYDFD